MKEGSSLIQWEDYGGMFYLETSSEKLVDYLKEVGINPKGKDEETGLYWYQLPASWLGIELGDKSRFVRLCWYPKKDNEQKRKILHLVKNDQR